MDYEIAKNIYERALALDLPLGEIDTVVSAIEDEDLRSQLAKALGNVVGAVYKELMYPLEQEYPVLITEHKRITGGRISD